MNNRLIIDNFSDDIESVLSEANKCSYRTQAFGGNNYMGISIGFSVWAYEKFSEILSAEVFPDFDYYRKYESGMKQETFIHSDGSISQYAAILSLRNKNGGLAFWHHKELGLIRPSDDPSLINKFVIDGLDESKWDMTESIEMEKNRCVIYDASLFHSRYPKEWTSEEARMVQVFFFDVKK